jgi:hypothetical protein
MPIISARQFIKTRRGRRIVAIAAFLLLATQVGSVLHTTGHALGDGGVSCQFCLLADQPTAAAAPLDPARPVSLFAGPAPGGDATAQRSIACCLPPVRGPPARS